MANPKLIICGSIALDRIMNFSGKYRDLIKPDKLHVLSLSVLLDKLEETPGGVAANIAYGLAQLGDRPIILGSVGPDAADYMNKLSAAGIDTGSVHVSKLPTASFNVMTDSDDNQVGGFYPGAMADAESLTLVPWAGQDVLVCVSAHDPGSMRSQVAECNRHGLRLIYDPGQQVSNSPAVSLKAGVDAAEVLIINDYELSVLCDKSGMSAEEIKAKVPVVITTLGKDGSLIDGAKAGGPHGIPACRPGKLVDPTGAGDGYRAGFLYGYLRQWQLPKCGRLGSVIASFAIERHGTQTELSKEAVIARYRQAFNEEITL
jgi:adenosine kinase